MDANGITPLHIAAKANYREIVSVLLKEKADATILDCQGKTPINLVVSNPHAARKLENLEPSSQYWKTKIDRKDLKFLGRDWTRLENHEKGWQISGRLHGSPCIVKYIIWDSRRNENFKKVCYEVGLMSTIHHPNIITFMGTFEHPEYGYCVVTEHLEGGSLKNFIQAQKDPIPLQQILRCAIEIGQGVAWLHSRDPCILYRGLRTSNIFMTQSGICKLSDFGWSQILGSSTNTEFSYLQGSNLPGEDVSTASDVFMFGQILVELLTRKPVETYEITSELFFERLRKEYLQKKNVDPRVDNLISITENCVDQIPSNRMSFENQLISLRQLLDREPEKPKEKEIETKLWDDEEQSPKKS